MQELLKSLSILAHLRASACEALLSVNYIGAIDQGTTSTRFMVFDRAGHVVCAAQKEHQQLFPAPGCVEHNAEPHLFLKTFETENYTRFSSAAV